MPTPELRGFRALVLLVVLACGREEAPEGVRWIEGDLGDAIPAAALWSAEEAFRWRLDLPESLAEWQVDGIEKVAGRSTGTLALRATSSDPSLTRAVSWRAEDLSELELTLYGLGPAEAVQLFWAGPGEAMVEDSSITLRRDDAERSGSLPVYRFRVGEHERWSGPVATLRLDPTTLPGREVQAIELRGLRRRLRPDRLAEAASRAVKLELGSDVRAALLAPARARHTRSVRVPPAGRLRFAYGVTPHAGSPIAFEVLASRAGGEEERLFSRDLDPRAAADRGRWHEATVDLSSLAGREVDLTLVTRTDDPAPGLAAWADPELVAPPLRGSPWDRGRPARSLPLRGSPWDRGRPARSLPNVLLVVLDTLRADRLSLYGYERATSPHLDAWAKRSAVVFERAVAPASWTLPSHVSLFSGLDALTHGVNYAGRIPPSVPLLAQRLRGEGYATVAFTGGGFVGPDFGFDRGFDSFDFLSSRHRLAGAIHDFEKALDGPRRWLAERSGDGRPYFLFLHTYAAHTPYQARQPHYGHFTGDATTSGVVARTVQRKRSAADGFVQRFSTERRGEDGTWQALSGTEATRLVSDLYDSEVAYVDELVSRFVEEAEGSGPTLVVVTSDHGEALGEHGLFSHTSLHDFIVLVPLIVALPDGRFAGSRVPTQVRLTDVAPTVLEALGLDAGQVDGASLLPLLDGRESAHRDAVSYAGSPNAGIALRAGDRWKYVLHNSAWSPLLGRDALYDLRDDPEERVEASLPAEQRAELRRRLADLYFERVPAVRVRLRNCPEGKPFALRIEGEGGAPTGVKSLDAPAGALVATDLGTRAEVAPGADFTVVLEGPQAARVAWSVEEPGSPAGAWRKVFDRPDGDGVADWRVASGPDGWREGAGDDGCGGIEVRTTLASPPDTDEPDPNEEQRERLRSLGYQ